MPGLPMFTKRDLQKESVEDMEDGKMTKTAAPAEADTKDSAGAEEKDAANAEVNMSGEAHRKEQREAIREARTRVIRRILIKIAAIAVGLFIVFHFFFTFRIMHDNRMFPTLRDGEFILYSRVMEPTYDQVVLYTAPDGQEHVGRIIAAPGESVEISENQGVLVNGVMIYESNPYPTKPGEYTGITQLGDNEYYILCDFRESMEDSRTFGPVTKDSIIGSAVFTMRHRGL